MVDPLGTQSSFIYDAQGNLTQLTTGNGNTARVTALNYTIAGYVERITDPLSRIHTLSYDGFGRVTSETLPGDRTVVYAYDADGNLTSLTPPGRPAHIFSMTAWGC